MPKRKIEPTEQPESYFIGEEGAPEVFERAGYFALFTDGDTVELNIEDFCVPEYLAPFYEGKLSATYEGKRVVSASRDGGVYRLMFEDGSRAAIVERQKMTLVLVPVKVVPFENIAATDDVDTAVDTLFNTTEG